MTPLELEEYMARLNAYRHMTHAADILISAGFREEGLQIRFERDRKSERVDQLKGMYKATNWDQE